MSVLLGLMRRQVTVEPHTGTSANGPVFGAGVPVRCLIEQKTRTIRRPDGTEIVGKTTLFCPLGTVAPAESRVTLPDGSVTRVLFAIPHDGGGLPTPDHLELLLE